MNCIKNLDGELVVLAWPTQLLIAYCLAVVAASVCGGIATSAIRFTHTRLQLLVSFVGGLMLGVGLLHQWPHAVALLVDRDPAFALNWSAGWMMAGLLAMFFLLRMFHFHHHEPWDAGGPRDGEHDHDHDHDCGHDHDHDHDHHGGSTGGIQGVSWAGVTFGLCLHTILDGVALASHVESEALHQHAGAWTLLGFGTFLGIVLHKPLDSLSITSLMLAAGWSAGWRHAVNIGYALMCPLGALLLVGGLRIFSAEESLLASAALAFSAGVFVSIALSDLLPEVQFHSHDRLKLSAALLLGAAVAWGIGFLEPAHAHGRHGGENTGEQQPLEHEETHPHSH